MTKNKSMQIVTIPECIANKTTREKQYLVNDAGSVKACPLVENYKDAWSLIHNHIYVAVWAETPEQAKRMGMRQMISNVLDRYGLSGEVTFIEKVQE